MTRGYQGGKEVICTSNNTRKIKIAKRKMRTYKITCFTKATPDELFRRKVDQPDYEEALRIASAYNLDTDLVYQKRWLLSRVSTESIEQFLDKIKEKRWVLPECLRRVTNDASTTKMLLEYGLKHTLLPNLEEDRYRIFLFFLS